MKTRHLARARTALFTESGDGVNAGAPAMKP
jgi:hypothetical protein